MSLDAPPAPPQKPAPRGGDPEPLPVMSFLDHLSDLRRTLFWTIGIGTVASSAGWFVAQPVLDMLVPEKLGKVYFSSPSEGFMVRLKASVVLGLLAAFPFLLGRLWSFVAPGLFKHEKRAVFPVLIAGSVLFYGGLAFGYFAVVPRMVDFFLSFSGNRLSPLLNVTEYFMFVAKFCLAFGIAFQLPLVIVLLAALGLVTPQRLWSQWRYGVIVIFIIAAVLTPPDAMSQIMMGAPLVVLYMLSIGLAFVFARRRRRRRR